ncbi:MAG: FAD/NAD(P)-binding protein [Thermoplasmatales archaeon]|nr:FAD/NAD(P)-binding protein [Thermoplasmatales archaeon]
MENSYIPNSAVINEVRNLTYDTKLFKLQFKDKNIQKNFDYKPGQFVEIGVFGYGEAPISITSSPSTKDYFELCIKNMGNVTNKLHQMKKNDMVYVRGPYGNSFPFDEVKNKDILFVAGGIGLAPLRSLINEMLAHRNEFGKIQALYGARTPEDMIFTDELEEWSKRIKVLTTVDKGDFRWKGNVGVVGTLLTNIKAETENAVAFVCGPPIMIKFVIQDIVKLGFRDENIITTLERKMQCGIGKCGHCNIGGKYVCTDGPVFTYKQIKELPEALQ